MNSFKSKYPSFSALLALAGLLAQDFAASGVSLVQKLYSLTNIVPAVINFIPMIGGLAAEIVLLKASPTDMEEGAEVLVTDLGFTNAKAVGIIAAAFPVGEQIAALFAPVQSLIAAIKA